ncbi:glycoside hydrolase family 2 TIM barrel-domain containing protein [Clostridium fungisolvens]|uniref:Beta-galactosidase BoGH2A n=1 Tax=Clostridium fungisolvens TaxID=1604897 RepID=A0A6V8SK48_9CLOT|nr:glycoside hydrolase family 2 TIM barrel-domain containing protein [Clostridium fungisolvens]GFP77547.1 Beta-galactosidase BoGH2A [Clostridium fungisolvens]
MQVIDFNANWNYKHLNVNDEAKIINIPHDAMLSEPRSEANPGGGNISWFAGGDYLYSKTFDVPMEYCDKTIVFEFEGVYKNSEVYINGEKAGYRPYGYTNFYVEAHRFLKFGEKNEIQVIVHNSDQPNSRWYSGSGIYRPVHMYVLNKDHILLNGVKIRTISIEPAVIEVDVDTTDAGEVQVEIIDKEIVVAKKKAYTDRKVTLQIEIPNAKSWDLENPNLYTCKVTFGEEQVEESFGMRTLEVDSEHGLRINGKRVILRGACIHHDNGILGACCYPEAEERKVRILKENGYNSIRSAHNPCSKALLEACDRLGMLVMDEYVDVWYIHKTEYDYVNYFMDWWQEDLKDMVDKDYNHPCVVMYSTGNEVSETAQKRGIELTGQMTEYLHSLDPTRPVTCGVNIFFNFLSSIGFGVYTDEKAKKNADKAIEDEQSLLSGKKKKKPVGSEFYNTLAGIFGDTTMKVGATLRGCDVKTRDAYANMDIAGYNYGILRYKSDLKKYPKRLILGTETFCKDAYSFWEMAKKHPRIIGDFVWAGMDYLGEVGIGSWEYEEYAPRFDNGNGWMTAGSGRIDIIGNPIGEAAYTKVAFECTDKPIIAVRPVSQKGKHSPSAWKMTDARESWSWNGCNGNKAIVEVYVRAYMVELLINGKSVGRKKIGNGCRAIFKTTYEDGEIRAIAYDDNGREISDSSLKTAGNDTVLRAVPEEKTVKQGGLCYIRLQYTDKDGIVKPKERNILHIKVDGGTLLGLGSACPYNVDGYLNDYTDTYYGEALAVVKAEEVGEIIFTVTDGKLSSSVKVLCEVR